MSDDKKHRQNEAVVFTGCFLLGGYFLLSTIAYVVTAHDEAARLHEFSRDWPIALVGGVLLGLGFWGFAWHRRKYRLIDTQKEPKPIKKITVVQAILTVPILVLYTLVMSTKETFVDHLIGNLFFGLAIWALLRVVEKFKA